MMISLLMAVAMLSVEGAADLSEAELKHYFMVCDQGTSTGMMDDADAASCSVVYELLKARIFNGDSQALLEWWRKEKEERAIAEPRSAN